MKNAISIMCFVFVAYACCLATSPVAQDHGIKFSSKPAESFKVSNLSWSGSFGGRKEEPKTVYCLMTQGFFRAPTSDSYEKLIADWLTQHPNANVTVVYTLPDMMSDSPDSKLISVWIVDNEDSLNVFLVRKGACPAGTMVLNDGDKAQVNQQDYESFAKKVWEAEMLAKKDKIGIWKE
jgi:hypothetical protein